MISINGMINIMAFYRSSSEQKWPAAVKMTKKQLAYGVSR